jgi:RHS repeat-associated protein
MYIGRGEVVATTRGGTAYLGSVRSTTNALGAIEDRYEYDAFGTPYKGDLTTGMSLGYTGKPYDALTGLYNYGYRDYQPQVARFITADPVRDGSNWFAYVNNDPVNWIDRWGLRRER